MLKISLKRLLRLTVFILLALSGRPIQVEANEDQLESLVASPAEREELVLKAKASLDKRLQKEKAKRDKLVSAQQSVMARAESWKSLQTQILHFIEDKRPETESESLKIFRERLQSLLRESNSKVWNGKKFEEALWQTESEDRSEPETFHFQVRETDPPQVKSLIQSIDSTQDEILKLEMETQQVRSAVLAEHIQWERRYRSEILRTRGVLLSLVPPTRAVSPQTIWMEVRTIGAEVSFWLWSRAIIHPIAPQSSLEMRWSQVARGIALIKLILVLFLGAFLLLKRGPLLGRLRSQLLKRTTSIKQERWALRALAVVGSLYTFLILLVAGKIVIDAIADLGFQEVRHLSPHLENILIFFFLWGMIDLLTPVISQRRNRILLNEGEASAVEKTFRFFPRLILIYWLFHELIERLLLQFLNENLSIRLVEQVLWISVGLAVFAGIWVERSAWRLVSNKASRSPTWQAILANSKSKPWEPLVLVIGGGLGVYLVAWRLIKSRIGQLEFTKSFQAMLSRALLERKKRKSLFRLSPERYPPHYLDRFDHHREVESEWYVERKTLESDLESAFKKWSEDKKGTSVLVLGDRGVGKSALILNFLQKRKVTPKKIVLRAGDFSREQISQDLYKQIFNQDNQVDTSSLLKELNDMDPSVICLENLENSILRKVGGYQNYLLILDLILKTSRKHLWIATMTPYAWSITKRAVQGSDCFSYRIYVPGMSEQEIELLILKRHEVESDLKIDFSELSFESESSHSQNNSEELEDKRQSLYFRILWDYTYGNPRQALYFWKTSLGWKDRSVKVFLFDVPETGVLEQLSTEALMLLAAIVEHNGMTLKGLQSVFNEAEDSILRWIQEISAFEILYNFKDPQNGNEGWHVESFWIASVEAYLEKRMLLFRGGLK